MKTWTICGEWNHERTGSDVHQMQFLVFTHDDKDPLQALNEEYDLSAMTYLRGKITQVTDQKAFTLGHGLPVPIHRK